MRFQVAVGHLHVIFEVLHSVHYHMIKRPLVIQTKCTTFIYCIAYLLHGAESFLRS